MGEKILDVTEVNCFGENCRFFPQQLMPFQKCMQKKLREKMGGVYRHPEQIKKIFADVARECRGMMYSFKEEKETVLPLNEHGEISFSAPLDCNVEGGVINCKRVLRRKYKPKPYSLATPQERKAYVEWRATHHPRYIRESSRWSPSEISKREKEFFESEQPRSFKEWKERRDEGQAFIEQMLREMNDF